MKTFLKVLGAFVVLAIISVVLLLRSVNSDSNKAAIREAVLAASGYELTIAGDMNIDFFPSLGLVLNDVRLKNPAYPQELASTSAATLKTDLGSLLSGNLLVEELSADDFHFNYFVDASGNNIWVVDHQIEVSSTEARLEEAITANFPQESQVSAGDFSTLSFQRINISNASVDIQDLTTDTLLSIKGLNLNSIDANLDGRPFAIEMNFEFLNSRMSEALPIRLSSNVVADTNEENIQLDDIEFSVTPMLMQGSMTIENFSENLLVNGSIQSNSFDVNGLMETLGIIESSDTFNANVPSDAALFSMRADFTANENELSIPAISANLGDASISGDMGIRFATELTPTSIRYDIRSGAINLDPFIGTDDAVVANSESNVPVTSSSNNQNQEETELPLELLNRVNIIGSASIASVSARDMTFENINVFTNLEDGLLDLEFQPINAYDGNLQGHMRIDARGSEARMESQLNINQLSLSQLVPEISRLNSVTGRLNVESSYESTGNTTTQLIDSLKGSTAFEITENSVDIGVIKQVFTAIAALSPSGGEIQQWPDVVRFNEFGGYILLEEGIKEGQEVKLRMDNFDVSGTGGIDLLAGNFNYDLLFTVLGEPELQTIQIDDLYHNVSWPVQCSAEFYEDVSQYCGPDFSQVRIIFSQLGTNAIRSRLDEVIIDQVPSELQDSARGLLRNLFNR